MVKLIRDFIVVLVTCKNEEDLIKNEGPRVLTTLYIDFSNAIVSGLIWFKFEHCMSSFSARMKKIQSKMKALVLTTLNIDFSDTKGHLTLQSLVDFGRISNSSILL